MDRRSSRIGLILVLLLAVGLIASAEYWRSAKKNSAIGIARTQEAIQHIDDQLQANRTETDEMLRRLSIDGLAGLDSLGNDPSYFANAVASAKEGVASYEATSGILSPDYPTAIQKTAETIAAIWGELDPDVKFSHALIDVAANVYEAQSLLRQESQLLEVRLVLQQQLARVQNLTQQNQQELDKMLSDLRSGSQAGSDSFRQWLTSHRLSEKDMIAKAIESAARKSCRVGARTAMGAVAIAPDQGIAELESIPDINPDFITALKEQNALLARGDEYSVSLAGGTDKYADHTYIPIFAPKSSARLRTAT